MVDARARIKRFDYVDYSAKARKLQEQLRLHCEAIETTLGTLDPSREISLALTKLEESYMWVGKALRSIE